MSVPAVSPGHPGASYTVTVRVSAPPHPALLPRLAQAVTSVGAVVVGMDLVEVAAAGTTVDLTRASRQRGPRRGRHEGARKSQCRVRHVSDRIFLYHLGGKIEVTPRVAVRTRQDLSLAYTPGVGRVASAIARRPADAWTLPQRVRSVAIATDGSAVLGLGARAAGGPPGHGGQGADVQAFRRRQRLPDLPGHPSTEALIDAVAAVAPGFGGINLEDIAAPACFEVEAELQRRLDIPVFHDDQHGTAIVVMAAVMNACRLTGRDMPGPAGRPGGLRGGGHGDGRGFARCRA